VEIVVDITGSEGAQFQGLTSKTKLTKLQPKSSENVGQVRLFGDWLLKIKFNYTIKQFSGKGPAAKQGARKTMGAEGGVAYEIERG